MRNDVIAILVLAVLVVACEEERTLTAAPPPALRPISVRIEGPAQVTVPAEVHFTAIQTWSDGSTRDVTASALWTSSNSAVLAVVAGVAKALTPGEVGLSAQLEGLTSQPRAVRVMPSSPQWNGAYTLTIGGGTCNASLPLPPELRQRRYTAANVQQSSLSLTVSVSDVGQFDGRILNPQVLFTFYNVVSLGRRVQKASAAEVFPGDVRLVSYRKAAYWAPISIMFIEVLPDGNRLAITGTATTTMSSSGFAGTLNGALSLYEPSRFNLLGVCSSSSHGFSLVRR